MNLNKELDRGTRVRLWEAGIDLGLSWTKFGDARQQKLQIEGRGTPRSLMYINFMLSDIRGYLAEGKLIALGKCVSPSISDGPICLPADSFTHVPENEEPMSNTVTASGWTYEHVRVLKQEDFNELINSALKTEEPLGKIISSEKTAIDHSPALESKRGGGRKNIYPIAEAIFKDLFEAKPHLRSGVAAKITEPFNQLYRKRYFGDGEKFAAISERTIRTHLNTFRKKLERTGRN